MQEKLILFLQANQDTNPHWVIISAAGSVREHTMYGDPATLLNLVNGREIIVLVPAGDVLLVSADLPKMNRSRLIQAIPYALEEQLTDDVEMLHFVAANYQDNKRLPVAIVARNKMVSWMEKLTSWRVRPDVVTSVLFAVPNEVQTWQVVLHNNQALVRISPYEGFSCDRTNLKQLLTLALAEHQDAPPTTISLYNYSDEPWQEKIANITILTETNPSADLYPDLAMYISDAPYINLLQGSFATRKSKRFASQDKLWKGISVIAILWVAILFLSPMVSYFILKQQLVDVEQEINKIYKYHFPQATSMIAPKLRMQEKLQHLTSSMGQHRALLLIGYLSKVLPHAKGINLKKMDYQNNRLTLDLTAKSSDELASFTDALTKLGLTVKQQNANLTGAVVNTTLTVE